jgi:hemerythrin-like domain-containing protein
MGNRREFLRAAPALLLTPKGKEKGEEDVKPAEDLMREHGVLNRVLLIYEEIGRRIGAARDFRPETLASAAGVVRDFIENYHEKQEEDFLFPRFRKAGRLVDLVDTLEAQHEAGRRQTAVIVQLATASGLKTADSRKRLVNAMHRFIHMYRPHEAREDTVLFPALHEIVSGHEYDAIGEQFEKNEHRLFGEDGFEKMVDRVAGLERELGIYDLAQFTPA